jgi:diguanylate cyclase (GGDEF)-like protein
LPDGKFRAKGGSPSEIRVKFQAEVADARFARESSCSNRDYRLRSPPSLPGSLGPAPPSGPAFSRAAIRFPSMTAGENDSDPDERAPRRRKPPTFWERRSYRLKYALVGIALATGAPGGALAIRLAEGVRDLHAEFREFGFFYLYDLIGTSIVFGASGFVAGRRVDELRRRRDRFQHLAETDYLTALPNDRAFRQHYQRAEEAARRSREPIALLLVDVDNLKAINDQFGHALGSSALAHVADAIRASKREEDMAARWGGDEFTVLMPGASLAAAERVAQSILAELERHPLRAGRALHTTTVSIGIATGSPNCPLDEIFSRADRALYRAKARGRNRYDAERG